MFAFTKDESIGDQIKPDFFYCLYEINKHFESLLHNQREIILPKYVKEHLEYQLNLKIKDDFLSPILVHEFEIANKAKVLDENAELLSFVKMTNLNEWKEYLFTKYDGLEERLISVVNNLSDYMLLFLKNLNNDKESIIQNFDIPIFQIEDIILFQGDFHGKNKFVIRVEFDQEKQLFFKPRDSYNEIFFENIINFFKKHTNIVVEFPKTLSFRNHSWMSRLNKKNDFTSIDEVEDYYENLGKLICIFYMMGSADIIPDNIIISNNKVGLFDLEIITTKTFLLQNNSIRAKFAESVKRIGILPEWMLVDVNLSSMILSSVFFNQNSQLVKSRVWNKRKFKFEIKDIPFSEDEDLHIPKIKDEFYELTHDLLLCVNKGFKNQYDFIQQNKLLVKNTIKENFHILKRIRVLFHATNIYSQFRSESLIPEHYKDQNKIFELIEELVFHFYSDGYEVDKKTLCNSIDQQIKSFDIPYFYFEIASKILKDGNDNSISNWDFSPLDLIFARIDNFSDRDLNFQIRIINESCSFAFDYFRVDNEQIATIKKIDPNPVEITKKSETYLAASEKIGMYLIDNYIAVGNEINWVSKVRESNGFYNISLLNYDLYDGLSGICMLYIHLHRITTKTIYRDTFVKIYDQLKETVKNQQHSQYYSNLPSEIEQNYPISPYSFPASFIYLTLQSEIFNTKENWEIIEDVISDLSELVKKTQQTDYLLGKFGLLDFLLSNKANFPDFIKPKITTIIRKLSDNLFDSAEYRLNQVYWPVYEATKQIESGGFAHGTSSAAFVLSKLGDIDEKSHNTCLLSLNHDRSFYNEEIDGWIDNREEKNVKNDPVSWCHGSSGIALGRMLMESSYCDELFINEYQIAKKNLLRKGLHANECVCHGSLGNMEILLALSTKLNDLNTKNSIYQYLNELSESIIKDINVIRHGVEGKTEVVGLFTGIAGISYQFLRFYDWKNTPSVLCLETKNYLNQILHES